jgi:hypothetical protein
MPPVPATQIATLREYTEWVEDRVASAGQLWFRGTGRAAYELTPTLYRHPSITDVQALIDLEGQIMTRFREPSITILGTVRG